MRIRKHTAVLAAIGIADLVSTLYLVARCGAAEANPLMAGLLARSPLLFAAAKVAILMVGLGIIEYAWRRQPAAALRAAKVGIVGYIALYACGVFHANNVPAPPTYGTRAAKATRIWQAIRQRVREHSENPPSWATQTARPTAEAEYPDAQA